MSNINLATKRNLQNNPKIMSKSLVISMVALILLLCLYGALLLINKKISAQTSSTHDQYETEYNKFLASNASDVVDFKNRSVVAQKLISEDKAMSNMLDQIESSILPAVYLSSYEYDKDKKTILLSCVGDNFNTEARQILSFKESGYFAQVIPGQSRIDAQTNQLNFTINLKLK